MKFFKTIRFRLTLWYSLLLLIISGSVILGINIIVTTYYNSNSPNLPQITFRPRNLPHNEELEEITEVQKEIIQEIRKQDLNKIRSLSIYSFIPLTLLSFFGGYFIADQMLKPLQQLNLTFTQLNSKNLDKKIKNENTGDEISILINNFNNMTSRLNKSFQLQKDFIANASHELKSPLAIIQTNLEAVTKKTTKKELEEYLGTSVNSVTFMNKLIEDLLLLSLLENHVNKKNYKVKDIINEVIKKALILAKSKLIVIKYKEDTKTKNKKVNMNPELIERAIMNIIENAIKYSKTKSNIYIELKIEKSNIVIIIRDEGFGIPKKDQDKIFDRFYRVDKSRSRKTGGTGLGLAITKQIINLHKGKLQVSSKIKKGTTFKIVLPFE